MCEEQNRLRSQYHLAGLLKISVDLNIYTKFQAKIEKYARIALIHNITNADVLLMTETLLLKHFCENEE